MKKLLLAVIFCWVSAQPGAAQPSASQPSASQDAVTLYWDDLLPINEDQVKERLKDAPREEGSTSADTPNDFLVVEALDGYKIRLPGFIVPLEFSPDGKLSNFLLVPYQGACIHEPPPPPNQIVHAKTDEPQAFPNIWTPVWLTGTMTTEQYLNFRGDAAYTMKIESWEVYRGPE